MPSDASRHLDVLIMYKVFEGGRGGCVWGFSSGDTPTPHPPQPQNSARATPSFLCCHASDDTRSVYGFAILIDCLLD